MTHTSLVPVETVTVVGQLSAAHIGATLEIDRMIVLRVDRVLHLNGITLIADGAAWGTMEWCRFNPDTACRVTSPKTRM